MAPHVDILDQPESLSRPLVGSLALHISLAATVVVFSLVGGRREFWGDRNAGGGSAMLINTVHQLPMPANSGNINPVANDTRSEAPEPKPEPVKKTVVKEPEPDAIPIPSRSTPKKPSPRAASVN